jgi:N4-gp56 family major capsid protein
MTTNLLLAPEIKQTYERRLLQRFRTTTIFNRFGMQKGIPAAGGVNMSFRRMEIIRPVATASTATWPADATYTNAAAVALTEGTFYTPTVTASWFEVTATVRQYGQAAYVSDILTKQAMDEQIPEYTDNFSEAMTELLDIVTRDVLLSGTNIQYANGRTSASAIVSGDFLSLAELRKAKRTLKRANVPPAEDGRYPVIAHPDTVYDLEGDSNITNVWTYGGAGSRQGDIFNTTFKDLPLGFRLYESSIAPISRASGYGDVYNTFVIGKEAYGTVKLDSMPAKIIWHPPGSSGVSDPLDQVGTIGWKANFAAVVLSNTNFVIIKHQASVFTGTRAGL